ncbi:MAG: DUF1778 domain-containing protein [Propionibacteriaceae bacterium]|jgi:uncharacterized protein (DUF1778 family)|nr:DUF1778 domain-containing protein [Propionibacteriaceae bacterium]
MAMVRSAAAVEGTTVTDFTATAAVARAGETQGDQLRVVLTPAAWDAFAAALDNPVPTPRLDRLRREPSVFDR